MRNKNPERAAKRRARDFGPQAKLCETLPCSVPGCRLGPVVAAHNPSRGAGGTDKDTAPLCWHHHDQQHRVGIKTFQRLHAIDLVQIARGLSDRVRYDPPGSNDKFTF